MTAQEQHVWDTAFAASFIARTVQQRPLAECETLALAEAGDCLRAFRKLVLDPPLGDDEPSASQGTK